MKGAMRVSDMSDTTKDQDELTEEEAAAKRDEVLKRMLNTPPKPRNSERGEVETPPRRS